MLQGKALCLMFQLRVQSLLRIQAMVMAEETQHFQAVSGHGSILGGEREGGKNTERYLSNKQLIQPDIFLSYIPFLKNSKVRSNILHNIAAV